MVVQIKIHGVFSIISFVKIHQSLVIVLQNSLIHCALRSLVTYCPARFTLIDEGTDVDAIFGICKDLDLFLLK